MARRKRRHWGSVTTCPPRSGFYVRFSWEGRRIWRAGGPTKDVAREKLQAAEILLKRGVPLEDVLADVFGDAGGTRTTFRDAAPSFLAFTKERKKASTFKADVPRLRLLCRAQWAGKYLSQIRPEDLMRWVEERRKQGTSGATINRDLGLASTLFRWAIRMGYTASNPVRKIERFSERGRARKLWLTPEECQSLLTAADDVFRPVLMCALHAGLRRGELMGLEWRSVDFSRTEIVVEPEIAKSGKARRIPMTAELRGCLRALKASRKVLKLNGTDPVFLSKTGRPLREGTMRRMLAETLAACKDIVSERKRAITLHVLRHSFASHLAQRGIPFQMIAQLLGHSSTYVTERYAHLSPDYGRAALSALEDAYQPIAKTSGA